MINVLKLIIFLINKEKQQSFNQQIQDLLLSMINCRRISII
jgi:hypothetical protein